MKLKLLIPMISLVLVLASCNNNKTGEVMKESETLNAAPSMEAKMMIIAKLSVKPESVKEFTEAAKETIEKSNSETGCSFYQLYQDPYDNTKFVFVEEYKNQAAVDFHFATEHFASFGAAIGEMIIGAPEIKIITVSKEVIQ